MDLHFNTPFTHGDPRLEGQGGMPRGLTLSLEPTTSQKPIASTAFEQRMKE
jgi:hypothetical protein